MDVNDILSLNNMDDKEGLHKWLNTASPREISEYLRRTYGTLARINELPYQHFVRDSLNVRLSEISTNNSERLIGSIDKLVSYTKTLELLTKILVAIGGLQLIFLLAQIVLHL